MRQSAAHYLSIEAFLEGLLALEKEGLLTAAVERHLLSNRIERRSFEPFLCFKADGYGRVQIHKSAGFELLALSWGSGQRSPIHGHEGERCWARVEMGTLRFTNYREVSERPLVLERLGAPREGGEGCLDGPADIHQVENPAGLAQPAASLHLYIRPFSECDIYDLERGEKRRMALHYDQPAEHGQG